MSISQCITYGIRIVSWHNNLVCDGMSKYILFFLLCILFICTEERFNVINICRYTNSQWQTMTNSPVLEDKHSTGFLEGMKVKWFSPRGIYPWETGTGTSRHPNIPPRAEANPRLGHLNEKHVPKKLIEIYMCKALASLSDSDNFSWSKGFNGSTWHFWSGATESAGFSWSQELSKLLSWQICLHLKLQTQRRASTSEHVFATLADDFWTITTNPGP